MRPRTKHPDPGSSAENVVCIIGRATSAYSETFIRAHIERLPAEVKVLYGGWLPLYTEDDRPLISTSLFRRGIRFALRRFHRSDPLRSRTVALRRFIRAERIQAVLAEYGPTGVSVMEACEIERIPLIVHFHGFDAHQRETLQTFGKEYPRMFEMASSIVAASRHMRDRLVALGARADKVRVNPYGVDASLFCGADPESAAPVFVAVGRFVDKKGPCLTLLAFKQVLDQCEEARLIMVGDGPLLEACKQLAKAVNISWAVEFSGVRTSLEIADTMRKARAFVQHSIRTSDGDSESLGVVFLEAGSSGLPVVATRHDGIPEVVIHCETGLLVEESNVHEMAGCMLQLAKNPALAARLGRRARERICAEFSIEKSIDGLWAIIKNAIQND